jgi:hypothetical protein
MFLHRYALAVGWPVPLLKRIMTSRDISEAMAYERLQPIGEARADFRAGIIASVIANINRKQGAKPFTPSDFMPEFGAKKRKQSSVLVEKIKEVFKVGNDSKPSH